MCAECGWERKKIYNIASQIDARIIWWPEGVVCSGVVMAWGGRGRLLNDGRFYRKKKNNFFLWLCLWFFDVGVVCAPCSRERFVFLFIIHLLFTLLLQVYVCMCSRVREKDNPFVVRMDILSISFSVDIRRFFVLCVLCLRRQSR